MNFPKILFSAIGLVLLAAGFASAEPAPSVFGRRAPVVLDDYKIDLAGNAYVVKGRGGARIDNSRGLINWKNEKVGVSVYFRLEHAQSDVGLFVTARGTGEIAVNASGKTFFVKLNDAANFKKYAVGRVNFPNLGYNRVNLRGKTLGDNGEFGEVSQVILEGVRGGANYVRNFENYWGRRGASVHLTYKMPPAKNPLEYLYSEITVPRGSDAVGSFFMTNGFAQGYCGLQVNSPTERRVIFSVWSSFKTENPNDVPDDQRVTKLRQGKSVSVQKFGGEGSGMQSFLRYRWKAGTTYSILTRVRPDGNGNTDFTAYFGVPDDSNPDIKRWSLIASFRRPKTNMWYNSAYSFLENFLPEQGYIERKMLLGNQWVCDRAGTWHELTECTFICDNTGNAKVRWDYTGGVADDKRFFFLQNCGFSNDNTIAGTKFKRNPSGKKPPMINFAALERI